MLLTMIFFWVTEAIPLSITSISSNFSFTIFIEFETKSIFSSYASPVVFLLLGGFIANNENQRKNFLKSISKIKINYDENEMVQIYW